MREVQQTLEKLTTTLSYLDENQHIWSSVPIMSTYRNHLAESLDSLKEELASQSDSIDFSGTTLQQLRITIAEKMDILDDILEAYAVDIDDERLLSEAENSKTDYLRLTNDGFERKVTSVLQLLDKHEKDLNNYGLSKDQIIDVEADFDIYKEKRVKPKLTPKEEESNSQQIHLLIEEGIHSAQRLKKVMISFRTSNTSFYNGFMAIDSITGDIT